MSGIIVVATVVHTFIFVKSQSNVVGGAGMGLGMGAYMAIISSALLIFSALSAKRENFADNTKRKNVSVA